MVTVVVVALVVVVVVVVVEVEQKLFESATRLTCRPHVQDWWPLEGAHARALSASTILFTLLIAIN